ncbi:MAG: FGGY-family carbohydrate kinase [Bacteroidales bacterium]|nr:FGGY-family carbohydrate kinase [Bacteroidales bacterium]MCM1147688.1 FGGY-family carbohydrate kinase [Bacteroidales bacterium]MCM1206783.1 FGGY-family carbohydrate kinase [Bacillota bacterium]MCM1510683.1 FGGY-family carbohydrate kinase [Clostridium sp.]
MNAKETIIAGKAILGIEFGSTRIKAVLIDENNKPVAQGCHEWENSLVDGLWTYSTEEIWYGLQDCYASLLKDVKAKYDCVITNLAAIGISAMMHGYMAFDENDKILVPFRTWRNTNTGKAASILSELFVYNIPLRWSISHLYQCILEDNDHVRNIKYLTTLAGYIHWQLTGEKVLGVGDASGMLPIDPETKDYNSEMVEKFDNLIQPKGYPWTLMDILPKVLCAGEHAGTLTDDGAKRLDVSGNLKGGIPLCPPEGDAGTGMVATNAVKQRTGNVSAGTSSFSMIVLEKDLSKPSEMIDMVTTPDGSLVAMVHCNNCTSDINAWVKLFKEYQELLGIPVDMNEIYGKLYNNALNGDADCGGVLAYNYISGEPVTGLAEGRPMLVRSANDKFNLANLFRSHLYATVAVLKLGNDILFNEEKVKVDRITGHGGLFKTKGVGQRILAAALNSPISVMETAGEGGAWGIALLAGYLINKESKSLADYLEYVVFDGNNGVAISPTQEDIEGFNKYIETYKAGLAIEQAAVNYKK